MLTKEMVKELIREAMHPVFKIAQNDVEATHGDTLPEQELELDEIFEKLSELVLEIANQNKPEKE